MRGLILFLRGPSGENLDGLLGGLAADANPLQPGEERVLRCEDAAFQVPVGSYVVGASYHGPAGWSDGDHDPKFPLHVGPDAHPYALLARYDGLGYFLVGDRRLRAPYDGGARRRLFLRINDDMPGNGNGSFNCRIRVWH